MIWLFTTVIEIASRILARVPRALRVGTGRCLGLFWFYVVRVRRGVALENVKKAFPQWDEKKIRKTVQKNFENYGCGFMEFLLLPALDRRIFEKIFVLEGYENFQKVMAQGKGIFVLSLHLGSWELMSASSMVMGVPFHVITKRFKAKGLNRVWVKLREDRGLKLISEEKSTFQILRAVRDGKVVGFMLDQFMGPPVGVKTRFFGHETGTAAALALFSDRTRAPVIPVYNVRQPDGRLRMVFEPEIPFMEQGSTEQNISFMTQVYTSKIEEIVKQYPEQWLWIHRRWKPFRH